MQMFRLLSMESNALNRANCLFPFTRAQGVLSYHLIQDTLQLFRGFPSHQQLLFIAQPQGIDIKKKGKLFITAKRWNNLAGKKKYKRKEPESKINRKNVKKESNKEGNDRQSNKKQERKKKYRKTKKKD